MALKLERTGLFTMANIGGPAGRCRSDQIARSSLKGISAMILARAALALLALSGTAFAQTTTNRFGDGGVPAFYQWTGDLPQAGTMLRSEALPGNLILPEASRGERILY